MPDTNPKAARAAADGKTPLELIETSLTHPMSRVMAHGAEKYGVRNWRKQPIYLRTYIAAIRRHNDAMADGEFFDQDSGEPHAAHVAACCQVILDARKHGTLVDDTDIAEVKPAGHQANVEGGSKDALIVDMGGMVVTDDVRAAYPGAIFTNVAPRGVVADEVDRCTAICETPQLCARMGCNTFCQSVSR